MKQTFAAYITDNYTKLADIQKPKDLYNLCLANPALKIDGWVQVGTAEVEVTLFPLEQVNGAQIELLKEQQQRVRAECESLWNNLEARIRELQCLEDKGEIHEPT